MGEDLPSATPEKSGHNQSATNQTASKHNSKPKKEIKPERRQPRRVLGFSETKFREFAGYFILIGWLWYDLIDSHGKVVKLCFLAASLTVAQGLACSFFKSWRKAIAVWIIAEVLVAVVVWGHSRPEPKVHFKFSLSMANNPDVWVDLTNNFPPRFNAPSPDGFPILMVPIHEGQTNFGLNLKVLNDSSVIAENAMFIFEYGSEYFRVPDLYWREFRYNGPPSITNNLPSFLLPDVMKGAWFRLSDELYPAEAAELPPLELTLTNMELPHTWSENFCIMWQSKNLIDNGFEFAICFIPPSKGVFHRPFWSKLEVTADGRLQVDFSPDMLIDKQ